MAKITSNKLKNLYLLCVDAQKTGKMVSAWSKCEIAEKTIHEIKKVKGTCIIGFEHVSNGEEIISKRPVKIQFSKVERIIIFAQYDEEELKYHNNPLTARVK